MDNPQAATINEMRQLIDAKLADGEWQFKALVHHCTWEQEEAFVNFQQQERRFHDTLVLPDGSRTTVLEFYRGIPLVLRPTRKFEFIKKT
jgi:hypothetical protein